MSIFPRLVVLLNLCCVTALLVAVVLHETAAPGARPSTALRVALLQETETPRCRPAPAPTAETEPHLQPPADCVPLRPAPPARPPRCPESP
ncbi:MAG: hypothetical protein ACKON9_09420, partial [Planctomycetaceae bacterium]